MQQRYLLNFDTKELIQYETDCLVVGGGVAGLSAAWSLRRRGINVALLTKGSLADNNSSHAQGGIAAAVGQDDSPELHMQDTITAGAGLCNNEAVDLLVHEGVKRVKDLISLGVKFDTANGEISLGREGCHRQNRILHANGDATGAEITGTLSKIIVDDPHIHVYENHFIVDIFVQDNICYGILSKNILSGELQVFWAKSVILATGGAGQLFSRTTNPSGATADGIAIAYRAGAEVMDMEFIQFHPTALSVPGKPSFLISEAVRGEGAFLRNIQGKRFMPNYHFMAELAPRDIVSRAILEEMAKTESSHVLLDVSHMNETKIKKRFPNIYAACREFGFDIAKEPIPVAPAAHYAMGGIKTGLWGETNIEGLYCCGEAGCSSVHGANRLASNSLLDALVWGGRAAEKAAEKIKNVRSVHRHFSNHARVGNKPSGHAIMREELRQIMDKYAGPLRNAKGLQMALALVDDMGYWHDCEISSLNEMEFCNMLTVAKLIINAAILRKESRGGHFRLDYPKSLESWKKHIALKQKL